MKHQVGGSSFRPQLGPKQRYILLHCHQSLRHFPVNIRKTPLAEFWELNSLEEPWEKEVICFQKEVFVFCYTIYWSKPMSSFFDSPPPKISKTNWCFYLYACLVLCVLIPSLILLITYVSVCHKLHKNKCNKKHTKILHLGPVQTLHSKPHAVSVTGWTVAWMQEWMTSVKCHTPPRCAFCCPLLRTWKPSVLSSHIHLGISRNHHDSLSWGRAELPDATSSTPASFETPSPPPPCSSSASIQGALPPTNTFRSLWFRTFLPLTSTLPISCHPFCSPKGIHVWTPAPSSAYHLCLTSCGLSYMSIKTF